MSNPTIRLAHVEVDGYSGMAAVVEGHDLEPEQTARAAAEVLSAPENSALRTREVHWSYVPRIKWCGQLGWPCDDEGEWHGHWFETRPSPDTAMTVVWFEREPVAAAVVSR